MGAEGEGVSGGNSTRDGGVVAGWAAGGLGDKEGGEVEEGDG